GSRTKTILRGTNRSFSRTKKKLAQQRVSSFVELQKKFPLKGARRGAKREKKRARHSSARKISCAKIPCRRFWARSASESPLAWQSATPVPVSGNAKSRWNRRGATSTGAFFRCLFSGRCSNRRENDMR